MENTNPLLFQGDVSEWYYSNAEIQTGPHQASEIYKMLVSQKASWADFVWKEGQGDWSRIMDTKPFSDFLPKKPVAKPQQDAKKKSPPPLSNLQSKKTKWFFYFNQTQFGPFLEDELEALFKGARISEDAYAWKEGMADWKLVRECVEFKGLFKNLPPSTRTERRRSPRVPLVAKVFAAKDEVLCVGVCRDISIGGMQVLTDKIPGSPGDQVKVNCSPSESHLSKLPSFTAKGEMVRVLEDGRGFSFRFIQLDEKAKKMIEAYIHDENE